MKHSLNLLSIFLTLLLLACETPAPTFPDECVPVKVIQGICGTAVFQIQDPAYYQYGENVDGEENVFLGELECPNLRVSINQDYSEQVLLAELDPENFAQDCARCYALVTYSGSKHHKVRIHETCKAKPVSND